jgi:hypothetical protein
MSIANETLAVSWEYESASDGQERLQLAFAMLFSDVGAKAIVDNLFVDNDR